MRFVTASGKPVAVTGPTVEPLWRSRFHADREHWYDQLLQRWSAVVKGKISSRLEDTDAERKHKIKVGVVPECSSANPDATRRSRSTAPDPAAAVQIDLVTAR